MTSRRRVVLAINPTASFGKGRHVGPLVAQQLRAAGYEVTSLAEASMADLTAAARRAIDAGTDALVVVGGDGMVHLGVNLVAGSTTPLGIVPSGTGNDTARGLGIPVGDPEAAIAQLIDALAAPARAIDAGLVHGADREVWFACILSAGFDAIVNERANRMRRPRGASRYTIALLRELAVLRPIRYRIELDGVARETEAVLLAVANNQSIGGGMLIAPDAQVDDGLFDVVIVAPVGRLRFLKLFPQVFKGTHTSLDLVEVVRAKRVRLQADGVVAYADGEPVGKLDMEIEIMPGALNVLTPPA